MKVQPRSTSHIVLFLIAEMAVVFIGVYGAFVLEGRREGRALDDRRDQILRLLVEDFRDASNGIEENKEAFTESFGGFLDAYEKGDKPPLYPIPIPAFVPIDTWGPLMSSGALEALDVDLIRAIEAVLAQVSPMAESAREYNAYVRQVLIPNLDKGEEEFYRDTGSLRGKYLWYYYSIKWMDGQMTRVAEAAAMAVEKIEASFDD